FPAQPPARRRLTARKKASPGTQGANVFGPHFRTPAPGLSAASPPAGPSSGPTEPALGPGPVPHHRLHGHGAPVAPHLQPDAPAGGHGTDLVDKLVLIADRRAV